MHLIPISSQSNQSNNPLSRTEKTILTYSSHPRPHSTLRRLRRLLPQPLQNTLIAKHKLPQALHHAKSLVPEVLHRLLDQIHIIPTQPLSITSIEEGVRGVAAWAAKGLEQCGTGVAFNVHGRNVPSVPRVLDALPLHHIDDRVDGAERTRSAAARAAVHEDGSGARRRWCRRRPAVGDAHDGIALFDEPEEVRWVRWGSEVRPVQVLQLGDFADGLEGLFDVGEGEAADRDVCLFGTWTRGVGFVLRGLASRGWVGRASSAYCWSVAVAMDL